MINVTQVLYFVALFRESLYNETKDGFQVDISRFDHPCDNR